MPLDGVGAFFMSMSNIEHGTIDQITPHERNANKGTQRGRGLIEHSLRTYGAGRSILLDKNKKAIAGNHVTEVAGDVGIDKIVYVHTTGNELVAVVRDDLDLDKDLTAQELAVMDNRSSELGLEWDASVLSEIAEQGGKLDVMFNENEMARILSFGEELDPNELWKGMPEFEQESLAWKTIKVHFANEQDYQAFSRLINQTLTPKTRYVWYPAQPPEDLTGYRVEDES